MVHGNYHYFFGTKMNLFDDFFIVIILLNFPQYANVQKQLF